MYFQRIDFVSEANGHVCTVMMKFIHPYCYYSRSISKNTYDNRDKGL
jgi:hypothetical protein